MNTPRQLSLVKFEFKDLPKKYHYPFSLDDKYLFLGEIINMPGHCTVINIKNNEIHIGYHTDNFVELKEDEI